MNFDEVLGHCGNFGYYQFLLMFLFGIVNIISSMHYFTQTIITFTPPHTCVDNLTQSEIADFYDGSEKSSCSIDDLKSGKTCQKFAYLYEKGYQSISTELNWVCDDSFKLAVGQSFFFVGSIVGTISFGLISDKFGRFPAFLLTSFTGAFGDFITSFTTTSSFFAVARFISGLSLDTMFDIMYVMVFEYLDNRSRTLGLNLVITIFYTIGLVCSPWLAILVGSWRWYLMAASLPTLIVFSYPLLICESAQWYIAQNRIKDAVKCLKYVAKVNRRKVPESVFENFEKYYTAKNDSRLNQKINDNFLKLFKTPRARIFIAILLIKSMFITLSYDVMGRNMEGLGISPFYLFSLSSSVYMPAGLTLILLQNRIGRRGTACSSQFSGFVFTGLTALFIHLMDYQNSIVGLTLLMCVCRYTTIVAYNADTQLTSELMPTTVRGQALANVHVIGYAFSFFSSYIIYWGLHFYRPLPMLIISVSMLLGALLCLKLPETLNKQLPETIAELEEFGKSEGNVILLKSNDGKT